MDDDAYFNEARAVFVAILCSKSLTPETMLSALDFDGLAAASTMIEIGPTLVREGVRAGAVLKTLRKACAGSERGAFALLEDAVKADLRDVQRMRITSWEGFGLESSPAALVRKSDFPANARTLFGPSSVNEQLVWGVFRAEAEKHTGPKRSAKSAVLRRHAKRQRKEELDDFKFDSSEELARRR